MRKFIGIGLILLAAMAAVVGFAAAQDTEDTEDTSVTEASAWLGIAVIEQDEQVVIARIQAGSPANAADLLIGDVIATFNGEAVTAASQLADLVDAAAPGDTVTVEVIRNGETVSIDVTLGSFVAMGRRGAPGMLGRGPIAADPLTWAERLLRADLEAADGGYTIVEVAENAPFALEAGDLVTAVNDLSVIDLDLTALHDSLAAMDEPALTLTVTRGGESVTLESELNALGRFGMERGFGGRGDFGGRGNFGPGRGGERGGNRGGFGRPGGQNAPETPPSDGQINVPSLPGSSEV